MVQVDQILEVMLSFASPLGWLAIATIGLVTIFVAIRCLQVGARLKQERHFLNQIALGFQSANTEDLDEEFIGSWLLRAPPQSVTAKAASMVWQSRRLPSPDVNAITSVVQAASDSRLAGLKVAPNSILLIGLIGTVLGLAGSVSTLAPQLQHALNEVNPELLMESLGVTIREMRTAFSATLCGIFGALVTGVLIRHVSLQYGKFLEQVQDLVVQELGPRLLPASMAVQLEDIRTVLEESKNFIQKVAKTMDQAADRFQQVLTQTGQAMTDSIEQLSGVSKSMNESMIEVSRDVRNSAKSLDQGTKQVRESAEALHEYHVDLRDAYTSLGKLFQESRDHLELQAKQQLERMGDMQQQFATSSQQIVSRVDLASERLAETSQAYNKAGESYLQAIGEVNTRIGGGFESLDENLGTVLAEHKREMSTVEENLREVIATLRDLSERMDPTLLPRDAWETANKSLHDTQLHIAGIQKTLSQVLNGITDGPTNIQGDLKEMQTKHEEHLTAIQEEATKAIIEQLEPLGYIKHELSHLRQHVAPEQEASQHMQLLQVLRQLGEKLDGLSSVAIPNAPQGSSASVEEYASADKAVELRK
jgi:hypothetical protein